MANCGNDSRHNRRYFHVCVVCAEHYQIIQRSRYANECGRSVQPDKLVGKSELGAGGFVCGGLACRAAGIEHSAGKVKILRISAFHFSLKSDFG